MNRLEDAIAIAQATDVPAAPAPAPEVPADAPAPAPAPEAPVPAPEPAAPVPDEPAPVVLPPDVRERLRLRREQKGESRELADLRRTVAELQARLGQPAPASGGIDPGRLRSNPIKALEEAGIDATSLLNTLSRHAIQPGTAELDQRHAQLEADLRALQESRQQENEAAEMSARQASAMRAREEFARMTGSTEKHPLLAKLSAARRMDRGTRAANELLSEGIDDFTMDDVAELAEQALRAEMTELLGRDPLAQEPPKAASAPAVKPDPRAKTITATAASATTAAPARPMSDRERLAEAIRIASR